MGAGESKAPTVLSEQFGFTISESRDPKLQFKNESCEDGIKATKNILKKYYTRISRLKYLTETKDFKKYKLLPGQELKRPARHGLPPHSAFYIYDGFIVEMGSCPYNCKKGSQSPFTMNENIIGMSTLKEFYSFAKKKNYKVSIEDFDASHKVSLRRIRKLIKLIGKWKYNAITANCQHAANLVKN